MIWQNCLTKFESEISEHEINSWLRTLHAEESSDSLHLFAPNQFVYNHIKENYFDLIESKTRELSNNQLMNVHIKIGSSGTPSFKNKAEAVANSENYESTISNDANSFSDFGDKPSVSQATFTNNLNSQLTFSNFVEGKSNQLAVASAKQVSENPGGAYNPLFIYGGVGLGKTHLMQSIGNRIRSEDKNAKVVYLHSERFVNDMITAIRSNRIDEFKRYYRSVDALLIDDIQFFAGKKSSMEEFFHTFNTLLEGQKQIVLTSDQYPRDVKGIDDRLKSRLNMGLTVEIQAPELETRVAILTKKMEEYDITLPSDAAFFMAKRFRSNVRDLEGALQRVLANVRLLGVKDINLDFVHDALRDQLASQEKMVTIDTIKKTVAEHYNIKVADLESKRRTRSIARPRQVAMALSKDLTSHSLPEIGTQFGNRDHTTVLHACRKIKELCLTDTVLSENYRILERTLTR